VTDQYQYDEFALIRWIREQVPPSEDVTVGIGDDAAVTAWSSGQLVISTDMLLEDTHFTAAAGWRVIGRKAMAVSLSDMAAMAARPKFAVCAVGLDEERKPEDAKSLFEGMQEIAADFGCQIVGGDLTSWARPTAVCTTVVGEPTGKGPLTRAGAQAGDRIVVTGELGGSSAGKHLLFLPRVIEAIYLNQNYKINACIDISDGLGQDLGHILEESGKGAALEHALSDGEDFELVFTMPPAECERLLADTEVGTKVSVIGGITSGGYIIQDSQGKIRKYNPEGYVHFRSGGIREFKSSPQEPQSSDRNGPGT
jgi:thiamine-monophosphate kinase